MGTELVAETSENLHILMRLSARGNFIVVNFSKPHVSGNWCCYEMSPEIGHSRGDRRVLTSGRLSLVELYDNGDLNLVSNKIMKKI
jgi:hypothetical protein